MMLHYQGNHIISRLKDKCKLKKNNQVETDGMHTYAAVCDSKLNLSQTLTCCPFLVFALHLPPVVSVFAAHTVWNSLPSGIRDSSSTHTFRRLLKTHCFQQAFGSPSGSPKCLRFGLWLTLNIDLLTYKLSPTTATIVYECDDF